MAGPGVAGPGVAGPGVAGPGVAGPGVAGPGVAGPGVAGPGVAGPGVAGPGVAGWRVALGCEEEVATVRRNVATASAWTFGRAPLRQLPGFVPGVDVSNKLTSWGPTLAVVGTV